jgi:hypothetical protein
MDQEDPDAFSSRAEAGLEVVHCPRKKEVGPLVQHDRRTLGLLDLCSTPLELPPPPDFLQN